MPSTYDIRRDNLRKLIREWHGPTSLAKKLGHSSGSYLAQLAGPNPSRDISERTAREIESKLDLPSGWMDRENANNLHPSRSLDEAGISDAVRLVSSCLRDAGLRPDPEKTAMLVTLVYERRVDTGAVDESYVKRLIKLMVGA